MHENLDIRKDTLRYVTLRYGLLKTVLKYNVDPVSGLIHCVCVGYIADFSEILTVSIFKAETLAVHGTIYRVSSPEKEIRILTLEPR